jgi:hypothetical protein
VPLGKCRARLKSRHADRNDRTTAIELTFEFIDRLSCPTAGGGKVPNPSFGSSKPTLGQPIDSSSSTMLPAGHSKATSSSM